jgi:hypothetical protein
MAVANVSDSTGVLWASTMQSHRRTYGIVSTTNLHWSNTLFFFHLSDHRQELFEALIQESHSDGAPNKPVSCSSMDLQGTNPLIAGAGKPDKTASRLKYKKAMSSTLHESGIIEDQPGNDVHGHQLSDGQKKKDTRG